MIEARNLETTEFDDSILGSFGKNERIT